MIVRVRVTTPNLLLPEGMPRIVDPMRAGAETTSRRELLLWASAAAGFLSVMVALTRLGA